MTGHESFHSTVHAAADRLPFALAESLWLVDVCNCSYEVAAANAGASTQELARRVHEARRQIAHQVRPYMASGLLRSPEGRVLPGPRTTSPLSLLRNSLDQSHRDCGASE